MSKPRNIRPPRASYGWTPGSIAFAKLNPQIVGEEIERLRLAHGEHLDAAELVTAAASPRSPLHAAFDWDDQRAAAQQRLHIARKLMHSVTIVIVTPERKEWIARAFVATPKKNQPGKSSYTSTQFAMTNAELRHEILKQALRELAAMKKKYAELSELAIVFAAVDSVLGKAS
jgi:hypothetical protein